MKVNMLIIIFPAGRERAPAAALPLLLIKKASQAQLRIRCIFAGCETGAGFPY
jgi:hypothetical protein